MPLLKEFSLAASQEDMGTRRKFDLETRSVTSLYERLFPKYKTEACWKVLVNCVTDTQAKGCRNLLGVYEVDIVADIERFFSLTDVEKKAWALEHLTTGITDLLPQTGWDPDPFIQTFQKAKQLNLRNVWLWKAVRSPSRKLIAEIWIDHDVQSCVISLVVRDISGQEIQRRELITELPHERAYVRHLGALTWESRTRVDLKNKQKDKIIIDIFLE